MGHRQLGCRPVALRRLLDAPASTMHSSFEIADGDHGWVEVRRHRVSHDVGWLNAARRYPGAPSFPGVRAIAMVEAEVERGGATSLERRPSLALDACLFARAVRCHWHAENRLHRVLDVVFHDDLRPALMVIGVGDPRSSALRCEIIGGFSPQLGSWPLPTITLRAGACVRAG